MLRMTLEWLSYKILELKTMLMRKGQLICHGLSNVSLGAFILCYKLYTSPNLIYIDNENFKI